MSDTRTLSNTSFPEYLSFEKLRAAGLAHLEDLGTELWTDFNVHDPGMTIVDILCYALTDLGYRANLPVEDLLAPNPASNGSAEEDNFFTAREILTCNPVTVADFRRLLIDTPGVNNAWLEITDRGEVPIYVNPERCELQYEVPDVYATAEQAEAEARLRLGGLYTVCLDVEGEEVIDACGDVSRTVESVVDRVRKVLHQHRNLCEDFLDFVVLGEEKIAVCADIELTTEADPETVLLAIYQNIQAFLAPVLNFYSLKEMLAKGKRIDEIFAGRPLRPESHGFIDPVELEQTDLRDALHVSDMYQVVMDIPGVRAIEKLIVTNYVNDIAQTLGEEWFVKLTPKHRPVLDVERTRINFLKDSLPFGVDRERVRKDYQELQEASTKAFRSNNELDRSIPTGTYREIEDYRSIQHEFPLLYGIGEYGPDLSGLDREERARRIAQARQLKGYLFFFDQILANYLSQLAHVRDLFSMRSDDDPAREHRDHTYFTQLLADVPDLEDLIGSADMEGSSNGNLSDGAGSADLGEFADFLTRISENSETYYERRNRFLDHLLARFAESFTNYVLLMYRLNGKRHDNEQILGDKTAFLQSYPAISRNRGKGFDYTGPDQIWNTANVSGLRQRTSRLVGIEDVSRRYLSHCGVVRTAGRYRFRVVQAGDVLAVSARDYPDQTTAAEAFERFLQRAGEESRYRRLAFEGFDHYGFGIVDDDGKIVAEYPRLFVAPEDRVAAQDAFARRMVDEGPFELEVEKIGNWYSFRVTVAAAGPTIQGRELFRGASEARRRGEQFLEWARDESRYEHLTKSGFTHYGFVLTDANGEPLAEGPRLEASQRIREARLLSLIGYVRQPSITCSVVQADECYFYVLYDAEFTPGEDDPEPHVLLAADRGYPTEAEAEEAFGDTFLPIARDLSHYERTYGDEGFGFVLRDPETGAVVANHPRFYNTEREREDRLQTVVLYVSDVPIEYDIPGHEGSFQYEIQDDGGTVQLEGRHTYPTEGSARGACGAAIRLARYRTYYRTVDDFGSEAPYGFELIDRDGELVAVHPHGYETTAARDEALDNLIERAAGADDGPLTCTVDGTPGSFTFELYLRQEGGGQRLLFESMATFPERSLAEKAYQAFLLLARRREHYHMEDNFSFAIREGSEEGGWGSIIATHPQVYVSGAERDAVIELVRAYLRDDPVVRKVLNTEGSYYLSLADASGETLLEGMETYPSLEAAEEAQHEFLEATSRPESYVATVNGPDSCPYGLEVRETSAGVGEGDVAPDLPGRLIAIHPRTYATAAARDERLHEIASYAGSEDPDLQIKGTDCGYYYEQQCAGHHFRSVHRFPHQGRAMRACIDAAAFLGAEERYKQPQEGSWTGKLVVTDSEGSTVTMYTGPVESPEDLKDVPREVVDAITTGSEIEVWYERDPSGYMVELTDRDTGEVLLRSREIRTPVLAYSPDGIFGTPEARDETITYLIDLLGDSPPTPEIVERDDRYYFTLMREEERVLIGRMGYETDRDARRSFDAFVDIGDEPENYRRFDLETDGTYGFEVHDPEVADRLHEAACMDCNRIVERAQNSDHFRRIVDNNECLFGIELTGENGHSLAIHEPFYRSETARAEQIEAIIDLVNDEGFHLVENLLLRPRNTGSPLSAQEADGFLPLSEGCLDDEGNICFLTSDPYSFRTTVVLPYWPERFEDPSFRSFFERTIRTEAPAHVYLRICWVTPCQMRAFEDAYRHWLRTQALPEYSCESTLALGRLLDVLCRLRNVYPEATLGACDSTVPGSRVILNQTLLGTANPDDDDNS